MRKHDLKCHINEDKAKLTKIQAKALEKVLQKTEDKVYIVRTRANPFISFSVFVGWAEHIVYKKIDLDTLIRALYVGYEIREDHLSEDGE